MRIGRWLPLMLLVTMPGCATLEDLGYGTSSGGGGLDEATVTAGLKEALTIGTDRTVDVTAQVDGYLGNELIRIALPRQFEPVASTLHNFGLGSLVDELETGMNRAAELAAAEARDIFWTAIKDMTVTDAFAILRGADSAATDYFEKKTRASLDARFRPIVQTKMDEVGVSRIYGQALDIYEGIPLTDKPEFVDLEDHVTDGALNGLFTVLAQEEMKIRKDPVARTTELLRKVFGSAGK